MTPEQQSSRADVARQQRAVLKSAPPKDTQRREKAAGVRFSMERVSLAEKKLYAAALVFRSNNSAAFRDTFEELALSATAQMVCYYARQMNTDPVVNEEVARILNEQTDANMALAADKRRAAIGALSKLNNILRANHEDAVMAVVGKPVSVLDDLPAHLRGVISEWSVRLTDGEPIIDKVKTRDPMKAAELLARWIEMSGGAEKVGYTAESVPIDIFPADQHGGGNNGAVGANGRANGEIGVEELE